MACPQPPHSRRLHAPRMSNDEQGTPRPDDETQPVRPEGAATPPPVPAAAPPVADATSPEPAARRGFAERLRHLRRSEDGNRTYGLAALIASALAGVIIGGLGLTAVHAITHDGPGDRFDRGWVQRREDRGGPGFDGRGGMHGGPGGVPGQVPPTTPPEDDSDG